MISKTYMIDFQNGLMEFACLNLLTPQTYSTDIIKANEHHTEGREDSKIPLLQMRGGDYKRIRKTTSLKRTIRPKPVGPVGAEKERGKKKPMREVSDLQDVKLASVKARG